MKEKEISLKNLVVEILLHWRMIILWMIIGAVVLGGYSYVASYKARQDAVAKNEEIKAEIEEKRKEFAETEAEYVDKGDETLEYLRSKLDAEQQGAVDNVLAYETYIKARKEYMQKSLLMQMDAMRIPQAELSFVVLADEDDKAHEIERIYEDMVSGGLYQYIEENNEGIVMEQAAELIGITRTTSGLLNGGSNFEVRVRAVSEEQCRVLTESVVEYLNLKHDAVQQIMGDHTLELIKNDYSFAMDYSIQSSQITSNHELVTWENNVAEWKADFSESEERYYNYVTIGKAVISDREEEMDEDVYQYETVLPVGISVKTAMLGVGLFAFIFVCYVVVCYVFRNKLRSEDDMELLFGVQSLGVIQGQERKKKVFDFVDKWIYKLNDLGRRKFSEQEALGVATTAVKIAVQKEEFHKVLCVGCDIKDGSAEVCQKIADKLKEDDIDTIVLNNILYNQEALGGIMEAKAAFLVETAGNTMYEEIANELEVLKRQGVSVLGILIVK